VNILIPAGSEADQADVLKGTGFSPYINYAKSTRASAPEGCSSGLLTKEQLLHLAHLRGRKRRAAVSVRFDPQVLDSLRAKSEGHPTGINDVLANLDSKSKWWAWTR
jgi:uncharacterized protein (DUF4415 family)